MNTKIYFEWYQPYEYVQYIQSLSPPLPGLIKLIRNVTANKAIRSFIQINELGVFSKWGGIENLIKYEEIFNISFQYKNISDKKFSTIQIDHFEDLDTNIPDKIEFAIPVNYDIRQLKVFFAEKGIKIEDKIGI